ncbi:hypothetical protein [Shimia ponticola]|uniref:hypothetical protein n=1 Tax=Shimia ponticola TaxID=2582893 RepID=UPI0011BEA7CD|nr:hypothetical protein [Shimia ponticola]
MARVEVRIEVLSGTFDAQPLVFAHLLDHATARGQSIDLDHVDVISKVDPQPRLRHFFPEAIVNQLIDLMGLDTTAVLVFPGAMDTAVGDSSRLRSLGQWLGSRTLPDAT